MPDVFISYSTVDGKLAEGIHRQLNAESLQVFLAALSLKPGDQWSENIKSNLRQSTWMIFLASEAACQSPYVQQELGMALALGKKIIPIVWNMAPSKCPGWISETQVLDLRNATIPQIAARVSEIAGAVKQDKQTTALIIGACFVGLLLWANSKS